MFVSCVPGFLPNTAPNLVLYPRAPNNPHFAVAISAAGLSHLAADPDNHWRVLESGNMLTMLLQALVRDHALAQRHVLRLLCGLVSNEATQADVVSAGVVRAVQEMSNRDTHASAISLILFNISCNPSLSGRYADSPVSLTGCGVEAFMDSTRIIAPFRQ